MLYVEINVNSYMYVGPQNKFVENFDILKVQLNSCY